MRRIIMLLCVGLFSFFVGMTSINAQSLDCSTLLKKGSRGESVRILQQMLNEKEKCNLALDGIFGTRTKNCVQQYQSHNNLSVDGIVGINTCSLLNGKTSSSKSSLTASSVKTYKRTGVVRAVVIVNKANVRSSASTSSKKIGTVKLGKVVEIIGQSNNWYKIKLNKTTGYISSELVSKDCIVVDISAQKLMVFTNGVKDWYTNVITGNKNVHDTPIGSYILEVANLKKDTYLNGEDEGGSYSSHVDYWMPFITVRGIGFHDASWRSPVQYNTNTYNGNGSHGCINMQHDAAEKLFTSIKKNTNVVVRK